MKAEIQKYLEAMEGADIRLGHWCPPKEDIQAWLGFLRLLEGPGGVRLEVEQIDPKCHRLAIRLYTENDFVALYYWDIPGVWDENLYLFRWAVNKLLPE